MIPVKFYARNGLKTIWEGRIFELPKPDDKIEIDGQCWKANDYNHILKNGIHFVEISLTPWRY